jgi:hypothetical protein
LPYERSATHRWPLTEKGSTQRILELILDSDFTTVQCGVPDPICFNKTKQAGIIIFSKHSIDPTLPTLALVPTVGRWKYL